MRIKKALFWKYFCLACIISSINVLYYTNPVIGGITVIFEILLLGHALIKNDLVQYVSMYVIFVANCIEYTSFAGIETNFYNLKDIRFMGMNLAAWLLIPPMVRVLCSPVPIGYIKYKQPDFYKNSRGLILINITALIVGAITVMCNDNGIRELNSVLREFVGMLYSMLYIPLSLFIVFMGIISSKTQKFWEIEVAIQVTFIANVVQMLVALVTHTYGYYGGVDTLLTSTLVFITPLMLLLFVCPDRVIYYKFTFITAIIGTALAVFFNANGKMIIITGIVAIVIFGKLLGSKNIFIKMLCILGIIIALSIFPIIIDIFTRDSIIFRSKYEDVLRLFEFGKGWINNLPESPRIRVEEYIDIAIEYFKKPWFLLTGKGYLGSILDHTGYFSEITIKAGAFQSSEWENGTFFKLHEMAQPLIMYGVMGIFYYLGLARTVLKRQKRDGWILIGAVWFFLLYGYSFTLSAFGFIVLYYGLCNRQDIDSNIITPAIK